MPNRLSLTESSLHTILTKKGKNNRFRSLSETEKDILHDFYVKLKSVSQIAQQRQIPLQKVYYILRLLYGTPNAKGTRHALNNYRQYIGKISAKLIVSKRKTFGLNDRQINYLIMFFVDGRSMQEIMLDSQHTVSYRHLLSLFRTFCHKLNQERDCSLNIAPILPFRVLRPYIEWDCMIFRLPESDKTALFGWLPHQDFITLPPTPIIEKRHISLIEQYRAALAKKGNHAFNLQQNDYVRARAQRYADFQRMERLPENDRTLLFQVQMQKNTIKAIAQRNSTSTSNIDKLLKKAIHAQSECSQP